MFTFTKTLAAAAAALAFSGAASADDAIKVSFTYAPDASVEQTYRAFERTAKKACKVKLRDVSSIAVKRKIEAACQADMMTKAVSTTGDAMLIALHDAETGIERPRPVLASRS